MSAGKTLVVHMSNRDGRVVVTAGPVTGTLRPMGELKAFEDELFASSSYDAMLACVRRWVEED